MHPAVERATDSDEPRTRCWLGLGASYETRAGGAIRRTIANVRRCRTGDVSWPRMSEHRAPGSRPSPRTSSTSPPSSAPTTTVRPIRPTPPSASRSAPPGIAAPRSSGAFNEAHILATTEAICRYRAAQGYSGPLFIGPRHARALRAGLRGRRSRCSSRDGVDVRVDARDGFTPTPAVSHAILVANRGPHRRRRARRRHRRHAVAQPARRRRLQVQPAQRRPGRHRRHALDPGRGQPDPRGVRRDGVDGHRARARSSGRAPRATAYDFLGAYVDDLPARRRHGRDRGVRAAHRRRPAGRRRRSTTGRAIAERHGARPDRHQRCRSTRRSAS